MYNALLLKQIGEHLEEGETIPEKLLPLLQAVSRTYDECAPAMGDGDADPAADPAADSIADSISGSIPDIRPDSSALLDSAGIADEERAARHAVERELAYRSSRLTALIENLKSGVVVEDENRRIIVINQIFCDMFSMKENAHALVGADASGMAERAKWKFVDPEGFLRRVNEVLAARERVMGDLLRLANGRTYERDYIPIFVEGIYRGHLWQCRDVTETRQAHAAIELLNEELREANHLLTVERERDKEVMARLEEVNQMKSEFVSSVSHELRTPLASIIGFAQTILMDPELPADMRGEFLQIILEEGRRLAKLINDLLDLARIESGRVVLERQRADIVPLIKRAIQSVAMQAEAKSLRLEEHLPESGIIARVDPDRLLQVMINLLGNAVKFTPDGGRITVRAALGEEGELMIEVADTGLGIPAEDIPRLSEKFFRVHRPGLDVRGTGLGLAIVKHAIALHGGSLAVQSEENVGSTFTIRIPQS